MELRVHSDTHLEAFIGTHETKLVEHFFPKGENEWEQVLVLCGDICSVPEKTNLLLNELSRRFRHIIYVPGNHEYYHSTLDATNDKLRRIQEKHTNVSIATNNSFSTLQIDDVRFVYGTLWTDPTDVRFVRMPLTKYLNDFRAIGDFSLLRMSELHKAQKEQLRLLLSEPFSGKTVVLTHHLPSFSLCSPRFGGQYDHGFASDCDDLLSSGLIELWCHGHTHDFIEVTIGSTKVVCNPTGYRGEWGGGFAGGGIYTVEV